MFSFSPNPIEVPVNRPVTFRLTSSDVDHGFEIVGTNANAMAIPGYVSQFTVTFTKPGTYTIGCNEYCGVMHHGMAGTLVVEDGESSR
jgi:cytochrome c oxidase subunit II